MDAGDSQIVALLATDLKHSYEQLVSTYWHRLKAFILRHVGSPQDAEDIVQEAFVRAYYALEAYPEQRILALKVRPWLYKITWSVYCNHIEHSKLQDSVPLDASEDSVFLELQDDGHEQPEEAFETGERRRELIALVDALPQRYREVVSLQRDPGFVAQIFPGKRTHQSEIFPETEGFALPCAGKEAGHGANGFRFVRLKLIGSGGLIARFMPFLLVDERESAVSMSSRLPCTNRISHWPHGKKTGNQHQQDEERDQEKATPLAFPVTQLFGSEREFVVAGHVAGG